MTTAKRHLLTVGGVLALALLALHAMGWAQGDPLSVTLEADPGVYVCCDMSTELLATAAGGEGGYTYAWTHDGLPLPGTGASMAVQESGRYEVTVADGADNTASASLTLQCRASIVGSLTGSGPFRIHADIENTCPPWTYTLSGPGGLSESWTESSLESVTDYPSGGHAVQSPGTYLLELVDDVGCQPSDVVFIPLEVTLSVDPEPPAGQDDHYVRCDRAVTLTAVANAPGDYTYEWKRGESVLTEEGPDLTLSPGAPGGTYAVKVTMLEEPSVWARDLVNVLETHLSVDASWHHNGGGTYTVEAEIREACPPWAWELKEGASAVADGEETEEWSATISIPDLGEGSYTLTIEDALGCTASCALEIEELKLTLSMDPPGHEWYLPCEGAVDLAASAQGGTGPYLFTWYRDGAEMSGETDDRIELTAPGTYEATVSDSADPPAEATASVEVKDHEIRIAGYAVKDVTGCGNSKVFRTIGDAYGGVRVSLFVPSSATAPAWSDEVPHAGETWSEEGVFCTVITLVASAPVPPEDRPLSETCRILVTDDLGCEAQHEFVVPVADPPAVDFPEAIPAPPDTYWLSCLSPSVSLVTLVDGGVAPYTYEWSPGGEPSSEIEVSYMPPGPPSPMTYTVTVTDAWGCTGCASAKVGADMTAPTVSITKSPNQRELTCSVKKIVLTGNADAGSPPYSYLWTRDDFTVGTEPILEVENPGVYTLKVTGSNGCSASSSVEIIRTVQLPTVDPGPDRLLTCANPSATLVASVCCGTEPYMVYEWYDEQGVSLPPDSGSGGKELTTYNKGTYTLCVTDIAQCRGCGDYTVVERKEYPTVEGGGDRFLTCTEPSAVLDTTVSGGVTPYQFDWTHNGAELETHTEDISVSEPGTYVLTVTGDNGCATPSAPFIVIEDKEPPAVDWVEDWELTCTVPSVELVATSVDGEPPPVPPCAYAYYWSPGGETSERITVWEPGTYTLLVTGENGCTTSCEFVVRFVDRWAPEYHDVVLEIGKAPTEEGALRLHFTGTVWDDCCVQVNGVQVSVGELTGNGAVSLETAEVTQALENEVFVEGDLLVEHMTGCPVIPYLEIFAADCRGNESSETWTLELNDTTSPGLRGFETVFLTSGDTGGSAVEFAFVVHDNWCIVADALRLALSSDGTARTGLLHLDVVQASHTRLEIMGALAVADPVPCTFPLWFELQVADCCGVTLRTTEEVWYPDTAAPRVTGAETLGDGWLEGESTVELPVHLLIEDDRCLDAASIAWELRCPEGCTAVPALELHELSERRAEITGTIGLGNTDRCPARWDLEIEAADCCGNVLATVVPAPPPEGGDGPPLVRNGGFEQDLAHWTYDGEGEPPFDIAEEGNLLYPAAAVAAAMQNGAFAPSACLYQDVDCWLAPGETYVLSSVMRRADTDGSALVILRYVDGQGVSPPGGEVASIGFADSGGTTDDWTSFASEPFVLPPLPAGCIALRLELRSEATHGACWWDEVRIERSEL